MAITDPSQIAASSDGTQGDNANALAMANIANQAVVDGRNGDGLLLEPGFEGRQ